VHGKDGFVVRMCRDWGIKDTRPQDVLRKLIVNRDPEILGVVREAREAASIDEALTPADSEFITASRRIMPRLRRVIRAIVDSVRDIFERLRIEIVMRRIDRMIVDIIAKGELPVIVADIDGTITESNMPVSDESLDVIIEQARLGVPFMMLTGISAATARKQLFDPLIGRLNERIDVDKSVLMNCIFASDNGTQIYIYDEELNNIRCVFNINMRKYLPTGKYNQIFKIVNSCIRLFDMRTMLQEKMGWQFNDEEWEKFRATCTVRRKIEGGVSQITLMVLSRNATHEQKEEFQAKGGEVLRNAYADYINSEFERLGIDVRAKVSGLSSIDINPAGIDKGWAIETISKLCNLTLDSIIFIGDAFGLRDNDTPALRFAEKGINVGARVAKSTHKGKEFLQLRGTGPRGFNNVIRSVIEYVTRFQRTSTRLPIASALMARLEAGPIQIQDAGAVIADGDLRDMQHLLDTHLQISFGGAIENYELFTQSFLNQCVAVGLAVNDKEYMKYLANITYDAVGNTSEGRDEAHLPVVPVHLSAGMGQLEFLIACEKRPDLDSFIVTTMDNSNMPIEGLLTLEFKVANQDTPINVFVSRIDPHARRLSGERDPQLLAALEELKELVSDRVVDTTPGVQATGRVLTNKLARLFDSILRSSFKTGRATEIPVDEGRGINWSEIREGFQFVTHDELMESLDVRGLPVNIHPGRGGETLGHGGLQAHIDSYIYENLSDEELKTLARHELAHLDIFNVERMSEQERQAIEGTDAYKTWEAWVEAGKREGRAQETFVNNLPGCNAVAVSRKIEQLARKKRRQNQRVASQVLVATPETVEPAVAMPLTPSEYARVWSPDIATHDEIVAAINPTLETAITALSGNDLDPITEVLRNIAATTNPDEISALEEAIRQLSRRYSIWSAYLGQRIDEARDSLSGSERNRVDALFTRARESVRAAQNEQWAVINAGGVGSRFWPVGYEKKPKQLLSFEPGEPSLLQSAVLRQVNPDNPNCISPDHVVIVTNANIVDEVWEQVKDIKVNGVGIPRENILGEPKGLNTGPALRLGALFIEQKTEGGPDAIIRALYADAVIPDHVSFNKVLANSADVAKFTNVYVEVGVTPGRELDGSLVVNPKLGHQQLGKDIGGDANYLLKRVEKEVKETPQATHDYYKGLVESGATWNSGCVVVRAGVLTDMIQTMHPEVEEVFQKYKDRLGEPSALEELYDELEEKGAKLPYDTFFSKDAVEGEYLRFGVVVTTGLEKDNWDDVGNLAESRRMAKIPSEDNFIAQGNEENITFEEDTEGNTVYATDDGTKVVLHSGVKDLIVAYERGCNSLLVLPRDDSARAGEVVKEITKQSSHYHRLLPYATGENPPATCGEAHEQDEHENTKTGDAIFVSDDTHNCRLTTSKGLIAAINLTGYHIEWDAGKNEIHVSLEKPAEPAVAMPPTPGVYAVSPERAEIKTTSVTAKHDGILPWLEEGIASGAIGENRDLIVFDSHLDVFAFSSGNDGWIATIRNTNMKVGKIYAVVPTMWGTVHSLNATAMNLAKSLNVEIVFGLEQLPQFDEPVTVSFENDFVDINLIHATKNEVAGRQREVARALSGRNIQIEGFHISNETEPEYADGEDKGFIVRNMWATLAEEGYDLEKKDTFTRLRARNPAKRKQAVADLKEDHPLLTEEIDAHLGALPISGKTILDRAKETGRPVLACNIDNGELSSLQIRSMMQAALDMNAFIMFEVGPAALLTYADGKPQLPEYCAREAYKLYKETGKSVTYAVHLDHNQINRKKYNTRGERRKAVREAVDRAKSALAVGFTSFATDTSTLTDIDKDTVKDQLLPVVNTATRILSAIYDEAKALGVEVGNEGEVGDIGTSISTVEDAVHYYQELVKKLGALSKRMGKDFTKEPLIDIIALNIGTAHGYTFNENDHLEPYTPGRINVERAKEVHEAFRKMDLDVGVALHGFSGTPIEFAEGFVNTGIAKVNINTDWQAIVWKVLYAYYPDLYREIFDLARASIPEKKKAGLVTDDASYDFEHARNRIMFGYARKLFREKKYHPLLARLTNALRDGTNTLIVAREQRLEDHVNIQLTPATLEDLAKDDGSCAEVTSQGAIDMLTGGRITELMTALGEKDVASDIEVDREAELRLQDWQIADLREAASEEKPSPATSFIVERIFALFGLPYRSTKEAPIVETIFMKLGPAFGTLGALTYSNPNNPLLNLGIFAAVLAISLILFVLSHAFNKEEDKYTSAIEAARTTLWFAIPVGLITLATQNIFVFCSIAAVATILTIMSHININIEALKARRATATIGQGPHSMGDLMNTGKQGIEALKERLDDTSISAKERARIADYLLRTNTGSHEDKAKWHSTLVAAEKAIYGPKTKVPRNFMADPYKTCMALERIGDLDLTEHLWDVLRLFFAVQREAVKIHREHRYHEIDTIKNIRNSCIYALNKLSSENMKDALFGITMNDVSAEAVQEMQEVVLPALDIVDGVFTEEDDAEMQKGLNPNLANNIRQEIFASLIAGERVNWSAMAREMDGWDFPEDPDAAKWINETAKPRCNPRITEYLKMRRNRGDAGILVYFLAESSVGSREALSELRSEIEQGQVPDRLKYRAAAAIPHLSLGDNDVEKATRVYEESDSWPIKGRAIVMLGLIGTAKAADALTQIVKGITLNQAGEHKSKLSKDMNYAILNLDLVCVEPILKDFDSYDPEVQLLIIGSLGAMKTPFVVEKALGFLQHKTNVDEERDVCIIAIASIGVMPDTVLDEFRKMLHPSFNISDRLRASIVKALGNSTNINVLPLLFDELDRYDPQVDLHSYLHVIDAIIEVDSPQAMNVLVNALNRLNKINFDDKALATPKERREHKIAGFVLNRCLGENIDLLIESLDMRRISMHDFKETLKTFYAWETTLLGKKMSGEAWDEVALMNLFAYDLADEELINRMIIFSEMSKKSIYPTNTLLRSAYDASVNQGVLDSSRLDEMLDSWARIQKNFYTQESSFDSQNRFYFMLGFSTYAHLRRYALEKSWATLVKKDDTDSPEGSLVLCHLYNDYKQAVANGSANVFGPIGSMSARESNALKVARYEQRQFLEWAMALKRRADSLGRDLVIVPNIVYGHFLTGSIKDELRKAGIEIRDAGVSSERADDAWSYDNRFHVKTQTFSMRFFRRLLGIDGKRPIVVVLDGTREFSSRNVPGKFVRLPAALMRVYIDTFIAIANVTAQGSIENYYPSFANLRSYDYIRTLLTRKSFNKLAEKVRIAAGENEITDGENYEIAHWNPLGLPLPSGREGREWRGSHDRYNNEGPIWPIGVNDIDGPALILVNLSMAPHEIPKEAGISGQGIVRSDFDDEEITESVKVVCEGTPGEKVGPPSVVGNLDEANYVPEEHRYLQQFNEANVPMVRYTEFVEAPEGPAEAEKAPKTLAAKKRPKRKDGGFVTLELLVGMGGLIILGILAIASIAGVAEPGVLIDALPAATGVAEPGVVIDALPAATGVAASTLFGMSMGTIGLVAVAALITVAVTVFVMKRVRGRREIGPTVHLEELTTRYREFTGDMDNIIDSLAGIVEPLTSVETGDPEVQGRLHEMVQDARRMHRDFITNGRDVFGETLKDLEESSRVVSVLSPQDRAHVSYALFLNRSFNIAHELIEGVRRWSGTSLKACKAVLSPEDFERAEEAHAALTERLELAKEHTDGLIASITPILPATEPKRGPVGRFLRSVPGIGRFFTIGAAFLSVIGAASLADAAPVATETAGELGREALPGIVGGISITAALPYVAAIAAVIVVVIIGVVIIRKRRVSALLSQAREHIENGRYSEALAIVNEISNNEEAEEIASEANEMRERAERPVIAIRSLSHGVATAVLHLLTFATMPMDTPLTTSRHSQSAVAILRQLHQRVSDLHVRTVEISVNQNRLPGPNEISELIEELEEIRSQANNVRDTLSQLRLPNPQATNQYLNQIVDILDDRIRVARNEILREPIADVGQLTDEACGMVQGLRLTGEDRNFELNIIDRPAISGAPIALQNIIGNLVENAREAAIARAGEEGEQARDAKWRTSEIQPPFVQVTVQELKDKALVEIRVKDNGKGIPEEVLGRIFELGVSSKEAESFGGRGLGLAEVQLIVEAHDGEVAVRSVSGEGAEFIIRLPIDQTKPAAKEAPAKKILVAIPDSADADAVRIIIRNAGISSEVVIEKGDPENLRSVTRSAEAREDIAMAVPLDESVLEALIANERLDDYLRLVDLHKFALENPLLMQINNVGDIESLITDETLKAMGLPELRAVQARLTNNLPGHVLNLINMSLNNMMAEQRAQNIVKATPLERETVAALHNLKESGEKRVMSIEVTSGGALKDVVETFQGRMAEMGWRNPKDYPVKLHVRLTVSDEDKGLLDIDKTRLLKELGINDILSEGDLAIMHESEASDMSLGEIYDDQLSEYGVSEKHVAIIGKRLNVPSTDVGRFEDAVLMEFDENIMSESIDGRICRLALGVLAKPDDPGFLPGVSRNDSKGYLRYIIEELPEAGTKEFHYELENYHNTMMSVVKDF